MLGDWRDPHSLFLLVLSPGDFLVLNNVVTFPSHSFRELGEAISNGIGFIFWTNFLYYSVLTWALLTVISGVRGLSKR